jgi:hypothetical protein
MGCRRSTAAHFIFLPNRINPPTARQSRLAPSSVPAMRCAVRQASHPIQQRLRCKGFLQKGKSFFADALLPEFIIGVGGHEKDAYLRFQRHHMMNQFLAVGARIAMDLCGELKPRRWKQEVGQQETKLALVCRAQLERFRASTGLEHRKIQPKPRPSPRNRWNMPSGRESRKGRTLARPNDDPKDQAVVRLIRSIHGIKDSCDVVRVVTAPINPKLRGPQGITAFIKRAGRIVGCCLSRGMIPSDLYHIGLVMSVG